MPAALSRSRGALSSVKAIAQRRSRVSGLTCPSATAYAGFWVGFCFLRGALAPRFWWFLFCFSELSTVVVVPTTCFFNYLF